MNERRNKIMITKELQPGMYIAKRRRNGWKRVFPFRYFTVRALVLFLALFFVMFALLFMFKAMAAETHKPKQKAAAPVQIEPGDTLWSIAENYYSEEFGTMQEFVLEIKRTNQLEDDRIHAGGYLIVPYYTSNVPIHFRNVKVQ